MEKMEVQFRRMHSLAAAGENYDPIRSGDKAIFAGTRAIGGTEDGESRVAEFVASTATVDRHNTIVRPEGIQTENFAKNPIFGWGHDVYGYSGPENVIGRVVDWASNELAFTINAEFATAAVNPMAETAYRLWRAEMLNTVSIGFYEIDGGFETVNGNEIYVYRKSELLEVSLVPIPANPEAVGIRSLIAQQARNSVSLPHEAEAVEAIGKLTQETSTRFAIGEAFRRHERQRRSQ